MQVYNFLLYTCQKYCAAAIVHVPNFTHIYDKIQVPGFGGVRVFAGTKKVIDKKGKKSKKKNKLNK